jgi:antitoxin VapB
VALNIKDAETDRLARELAGLTGESITVATRTAIEERLERARLARSATSQDLSAIIGRGRARRTVDERSEAEILGYDESGLPR